MGLTKVQLILYLEELLECGHGNVEIREDFDEFTIRIRVNECTLEESMFDYDQVSHIADVLTPNLTATDVEIMDERINIEEFDPQG